MILLGTDVLIDFALDREPHARHAAELLAYIEGRPRMAFVAWHSLSNFHYLVRPTRGGAAVRDFLVDLTRFVTVAAADTEALHFAASLPLKDFEDALQVAAARACGATVMATRNVRDYRRSPIRARTPKALLKELSG